MNSVAVAQQPSTASAGLFRTTFTRSANIGVIGLYGHHPIVQDLPGRFLRHGAAAPHYEIFGMAVRFSHSFTGSEVEPLIVITASIVVAAGIQHRDSGQPSVATQVNAALVGALDCSDVADAAIGNVVGILIVAADLLIEIEELFRGDGFTIERRQPVLHSDVVERPQRKTGDRVYAVDIAGYVEDRRTGAGRVGYRVITEFLRNRGIPYR